MCMSVEEGRGRIQKSRVDILTFASPEKDTSATRFLLLGSSIVGDNGRVFDGG